MNCYNGEEFLSEAVRSVLEQSYSNWELIFWNNASTDNSEIIIKSFHDERIKYYSSEILSSLGQARNFALEKCSGEYIAFLDTDDLWLSTKLQEQIQMFTLDESIGIVISNTIFFNSNKVSKTYYKTPPPQGYVTRNLIKNYYISLETVIIRKLFLQKLTTNFNPEFSIIEEMDFLIRLSYHCKLKYVDKVLGKWRVHANSLTWKQANSYPKEINIFIELLKKQHPDIASKFPKEIKSLEEKAILKNIHNNIEQGNKLSALNNLTKLNNPIYFVFLIPAIILPYTLTNFLLKLKGRVSA